MKKVLTKDNKELYEKVVIDRNDKSTYPSELTGNISDGLYGGISSELYGNLNGLTGNLSSELYGNISELYGNLSSELIGNISGIYGDCTGITGNLDDCELTDEEREKGVNIRDLVR